MELKLNRWYKVKPSESEREYLCKVWTNREDGAGFNTEYWFKYPDTAWQVNASVHFKSNGEYLHNHNIHVIGDWYE